MTGAAPDATATAYAETRASDWQRFAERGRAPLLDYWAAWEERSYGWRVPIQFLQPLGLDFPEWVERLAPVREALAALPEIDLVPPEWLHLRTLHLGFLRAADIMWSQVESFYVNAAPRIHRVAPFTLRLGGVSVAEDGVYLGADDGFALREVRRQAAAGVPRARQALQEDAELSPEGDRFVPRVMLGFFTGRGSRGHVLDALAAHREHDAGDLRITHAKMARLPIQPQDHYHQIDVVAEIALYGEQHRKGYHN